MLGNTSWFSDSHICCEEGSRSAKSYPALIAKCGKRENTERMKEKWRVLHRARTLGLAIWRPSLADFPHVPWVLTVRMERTTLCLVPSTASWHARRSSASSALDFAISSLIWNQERVRTLCEEGVCLLLFLAVSVTKCHKQFSLALSPCVRGDSCASLFKRYERFVAMGVLVVPCLQANLHVLNHTRLVLWDHLTIDK